MNELFLPLVTILAAAVSCGGAVFTLLFLRRGSDAELKSDVEELTLLVERLAKTARREKMARVRVGAAEAPVQQPLDYVPEGKSAIRARLAAITRR